MALFEYRGRNPDHQLVKGQHEAVSADAVATFLIENGVIPIDITPSSLKGGGAWLDVSVLKPKKTVPLDDLIFFSRQMYTLLRAGVPIMNALRGLHESTPSQTLAHVIGNLRESLDAGLDLSAAIRHHPDIFSSLFRGIVEVGESSGNLPESFLQLTRYLERERDTRNRIKASMRYPSIVVIALALALLVINVFVIPAFVSVFQRFDAELPLLTRIIIGMSNFTIHYWYVLIFGIVAMVLSVRAYLRTENGRYLWDRYQLRLPLIGKILFQAALSRFAYTMAITTKAGVGWSDGMRVVSSAVNNVYIAEKILQMREGVERGDTITHTAAVSGLFPPMVVQMMNVGEQTGDIEHLLAEVAGYYEMEMDYQLKALSTSIEPVLLVVVGAMVLVLALGVFMPMWGLGKAALS